MPYAPMSHPFVERLIETIRREYLDPTFVRNSIDLHRKLNAFRRYCNGVRVRLSLDCHTPKNRAGILQHRLPNSPTLAGKATTTGFLKFLLQIDSQFASHTEKWSSQHNQIGQQP